jgi:hypothetical protein
MIAAGADDQAHRHAEEVMKDPGLRVRIMVLRLAVVIIRW